MAEEKLKLPRSSYEELCKIIIAYGNLTSASSLEQVAAISGIGRTVISGNNAFLSAVKIIEGGKYKLATSQGRDLARALEHEIPDEIMKAWRMIVEENEFLTKMIMAVRIRKGMDISTLAQHIAYSAGEANAKYVMTGARTVIDILRSSGLAKEDGDMVVADNMISPEAEITKKEEIASTPIVEGPILKRPASPIINLNIQVNISVTPSEIDGLGEKIKLLIQDISKYKEPLEKD